MKGRISEIIVSAAGDRRTGSDSFEPREHIVRVADSPAARILCTFELVIWSECRNYAQERRPRRSSL